MKLLELFRKKKEIEKLKKPLPEKTAEVSTSAKEKEDKAHKEIVLGTSKFAGITLLKPHITEKSSALSDRGMYVFRVSGRATKPSIKRAVEELYKVRVTRVNVTKKPSRIRRLGKTRGRRPGYKKAIITLKNGQKIEFV